MVQTVPGRMEGTVRRKDQAMAAMATQTAREKAMVVAEKVHCSGTRGVRPTGKNVLRT